MASDSIIARPTNKVLVIVGAASGCCAIELKADATDFPSPNAGIMQPMPVVIPAVIIETIAIKIVLSIICLFSCYCFCFSDFFESCTAAVIYTVAKMLKI